MIINASARTDIPSYFTKWLLNRLKEGYVYVRNPYFPTQITKYQLNSDIIDSIVFCTKNPQPILLYIEDLKIYHPYFFVTITPYDQTIEPQVPDYHDVISSFQKLSLLLGKDCLCLRYDPIFINDVYTIEKHIEYFEEILKELEGYTHECVISFIDLYGKTKRNFPYIQEVSPSDQVIIASAFSKIANQYNIHLKTCAEEIDLKQYGITKEGCISQRVLKNIIGMPLVDQRGQPTRKECHCYPSRDIGEYNTCMHGCLYCYANENKKEVVEKMKRHDPFSPLLIGHVHKEDMIKEAKQETNIERQLSLDI